MENSKYAIKYGALLQNLKCIIIIALSMFLIQRLTLLFWSLSEVRFDVLQTLQAMLIGLVFDISFLTYALIPYILLFIVFPTFKSESFAKKLFGSMLDILNFIMIFGVLLTCIAEIFFWQEFTARFNFIAVDYLIYTTEVLKNIWESYPIFKLIFGLVIIDLLILIQINKNLNIQLTKESTKNYKLKVASTAIVVLILNHFFIHQKLSQIPEEIAYQEVSKNGGFSFFYAYFENQINYDQFYIKKDLNDAFKTVKDEIFSNMNTRFQEQDSLQRNVQYLNQQAGKPVNVVLVLMESMGARFLGAYGSKDNLTPHLDFLAKQGIFFNNIYATGTRTVRGIEALTLSVPPTPGQSIVRRPNNENLISLNSYFANANYDVQFVYGGYSYFDNMKYYFEHNHARVLDLTDAKKSEVQFANAWGMSDEDLYNFAIKNADSAVKQKKPFFQIILTTSNHRPFTYPDGKIDIPSGSGRRGAVKYADYAIGQFIEKSLDKEWFNNTIFIFAADHDASVAGNAEVNKRDYLVPVIFFAPKIIKAQTVSKLASQIDVGPTLLGILNMDHEAFAFGVDLLKNNPERAFISNYQKIGLLKNNFLTILEPMKKYKQYHVSQTDYTESTIDKSELDETISSYQVASFLFTSEKLKEKKSLANHER